MVIYNTGKEVMVWSKPARGSVMKAHIELNRNLVSIIKEGIVGFIPFCGDIRIS